MTEVFGQESFQIKAGPGGGCFFTQENIHGSGRPNVTGKTRVSMDFRIAAGIYGDYLGRKIPAGYFHLIPDTEEEEEMLAKQAPKPASFATGKNNIFYLANNTASTYGIPVHLQLYMLVDYCGIWSNNASVTLSCIASSRFLGLFGLLELSQISRPPVATILTFVKLLDDEHVLDEFVLETRRLRLNFGHVMALLNEKGIPTDKLSQGAAPMATAVAATRTIHASFSDEFTTQHGHARVSVTVPGSTPRRTSLRKSKSIREFVRRFSRWRRSD